MFREINCNIGTQQYFKLNKKLFVLALSSEGAYCVIFEKSNIEEFSKFLTKAKSKLGEKITDFKLVGPNNLITLLSNFLKSNSLKNIKEVHRNGDYEVFYLAKDNKLRVSKDEFVESKAVTKDAPLKEIKVLIVDDSKTIRTLLNRMLSSDPRLKICAEASKPSEVEALIKEHKPDVMTLDIHMPEMTGVELLKIIGPKYNIPTIMVTSISMEEGPLVLEALESGAFDYIQKPDMKEIAIVQPILIEKIKQAADSSKSLSQITKLGAKTVSQFNPDSLIVLGASTGGTNAIKDILVKFPREIPPMLIVQHIPPVFSKAFADRMNSVCPFEVREASDGDVLEKNLVLIAPGGKQMKLINQAGVLKVEINEDEPVNRFKPSVDYMFKTVIPTCKKKHVVSIILTGMGKDGALGMLALKNAGAYTIAQDEESSVVYGMPKEARDIGAAMSIEHKDDIAAKIGEYTWQDKKAS